MPRMPSSAPTLAHLAEVNIRDVGHLEDADLLGLTVDLVGDLLRCRLTTTAGGAREE